MDLSRLAVVPYRPATAAFATSAALARAAPRAETPTEKPKKALDPVLCGQAQFDGDVFSENMGEI